MEEDQQPQQPSASNGSRSVTVAAPAAAAPQTNGEPAADGGEEQEIPLAPFVLDFLQSERGHQLANKGLDLIDSFKRATLDERAKARALDGELAKLNLRQTWWLRTFGLVVVVGAIIVLSATNTLRPEAATILGAVAGYLFAQQSKTTS